jgi:hypothetical protein
MLMFNFSFSLSFSSDPNDNDSFVVFEFKLVSKSTKLAS